MAKKDEGHCFSGIGAILMADSRDVSKLSEHVSPVELIDRLNRVTTALIDAVKKNGGIVYLHVGGSLVAYWHPSKMPAAVRDVIAAAAEAVAECGASVAVSVAVAEFALADVGPATAKKRLLVGAAYQRAEATLRMSPAGIVAADLQTFAVLPLDLRARFVMKDGHAELQ